MEENQIPQENISPEQRNSILEQRRQRLQSMGLPMPVTPIVPSGVSNVKDPKMLEKIQQIRNGNLRQEFKSFENKANGKPDFEIPVPKPKTNPRQAQEGNKPKIHVPLEEFTAARDPKIDELDRMFDYDGGSRAGGGKPQTANKLREEFNSQPDDGGRSFSNEFRSKFNANLQKKQNEQAQFQQEYSYSQQNVMPIQSGMIILNEEDLKKKIIEIARPLAKQVATEVIKQVLSEYAKKSTTEKPVINEKTNPAPAKSSNKFEGEILPGGKIKIGGQIFKITNDK